jgi:pilus assembly protein TadC
MTPALAAAAASAAVLMSRADARGRSTRGRSARGRSAPGRLGLPTRRGSHQPRRSLLRACAVFGAAGVLMLGPVAVAAAVVATGALLARRRQRQEEGFGCADLAIALDVLAGCLAAGATMPAALAAAQIAAPARVADAFAAAGLALGHGDDPESIWTRLGLDIPSLAAVGRLCARAARTGAGVADELHRVAAAQRTSAETSRRRRLQRASVWLVLPLGLCFLPAFVLVGVVPLVAGAVPGLLHGG